MIKIHSPGTRLGRYEVVGFSTENTVCIEYTCLDREHARPVLLKTLRPELAASEAARERFSNVGADWLDLGDHPHIVYCKEVWQPENSDQVYLVLPVTVPERQRETPSLDSWLLPGRPLPAIQALLFALQIVRGMQYIVEQHLGFVHGDLKPQNIIVGAGRLSQADTNRLRVTDLGLASVLQTTGINPLEIEETAISQTQLLQGVTGTPLYMAPEQWRGEAKYTTSTDIYALGCLLYKMLVGRHPVAGDTTQALRDAHCDGRVRPMPYTLPEGIRTMTNRCLALGTKERYQSWNELETAIADAYKEITRYPAPVLEPTDTLSKSERKQEGWFLNSMGCLATDSGNTDTALECFELALKVGEQEDDQSLMGTITNNLGEAYRMQGNMQLASDHHQKALKIADEIQDQTVEGSALNGLGNDEIQRGNSRQAIQYFEKALALARKIRNKEGEMAALANMGNVYHLLGDIRRSIQYLEKALELAQKLGHRHRESMILTNLGGIYSDLSDDRRAIQYLEQSLVIKSELGERHTQIANLNNLANAYRNLGDVRQAFDTYNKSLEIALEMGDRRGEAYALNNIGSTYSDLGNLDTALTYHEQALEIFKEIGHKHGQGDCLTNLGFIYMRRHDTERALKYSEQALEIDRESGDVFGLALDSFNIANLLAQENRFLDALPYAEEAAQILEKMGHPEKAPQARALVSRLHAEIFSSKTESSNATVEFSDDLSQEISQVRQDNPTLTAKMSDQDIIELFKQADQASANDRPTAFVVRPAKIKQPEQTGANDPDFEKCSMDELIVKGQQLAFASRWQEAEQAYQTLLKKARQSNHILYQSLAFLFQGRLSSEMGKQSDALDLFLQALELAKQVGDLKLTSQIHDGMGSAYRRQRNFTESIKHHTFAIEICQKLGDEQGVILCRANLGNAYSDQGDFDQASQVFKELLAYALRINAEQLAAQAYCNLGLVYQRQGHRELAIETDLKSVELALKHGDQLTAAKVYKNLNTLYADKGDYQAAVQMLQKTVRIYEQLGIEPEIARNYADLARLYTDMDDSMQAFLSYDRALHYYERIGDDGNLAKMYFNMGNLYRQQGKTAQAREHFKQAQSIFESIGDLENAERAARQWR
jgi:tetratricopeptide (TPR) repeat protein